MIPSRQIFDERAGEYDRWFDEHGAVYQAQIRMLRAAVPRSGTGLEVGVGSGRFAGPLGIRSGIDPSRELIRIAKSRNLEVIQGEGEHLPYRPGSFDYVLMMTVVCFVDDPQPLFMEAFRALGPGGELIVGFIERDGKIAEQYRHEPVKGKFLQYARFRTAVETARFFHSAGFEKVSINRQEKGFCVMTGWTAPPSS